MPFKLNQDRRHRIPRQKHKVTNWPEYDASLRQRGSLTVWFTNEAIKAWQAEPRTTPGEAAQGSSDTVAGKAAEGGSLGIRPWRS